MSALATYWLNGWLETLTAFSTQPSLADREVADGVSSDRLYRRMLDRGELVISGDHITDVRELLREALGSTGGDRR